MQRRRLEAELLEQRNLLAVVGSVFQNQFQPFDVNQDLRVSAIDALLVINRILIQDGDSSLPPVNDVGQFFDVNGLSGVTALDALLVINRLGREDAILSARLIHDSGPGDTVNFDLNSDRYGIELQLNNAGPGDRIEARIDGGAADAFVDITDLLQGLPMQQLPESVVDTLAAAALSDGEHLFEFRVAGHPEILSAIVSVDKTAPTIDSVDPDVGVADNGIVRVAFSESIDATALNAETVRLVNQSTAASIAPLSMELNDSGDLLDLAYGSLPPGDYELIIDGAAITDTTGNRLGSGDLTFPFTVGVQQADAVWISDQDGFWADPGNWQDGRVPQAGDNVLISVAEDITVSVSGQIQVNRLISNNSLNFFSGQLSVSDRIELNADSVVSRNFTISGGRLTGTTLLVTDDLELDDVVVANDLIVSGGTVDITNGLMLQGRVTLSDVEPAGRGLSLLQFAPNVDHALSGDGEIVFAGDSDSQQLVIQQNASLDIGPAITLRGNGNLTDQISISGDGSWTNRGLIDGRDTIVNLDGKFGTPNLNQAKLLRNDQTRIVILGELDNVGETLTIDSQADWSLAGATVTGGTINGDPLAFTTAELNGVTLNTDLVDGQRLLVIDQLIGSGTVRIGESTNSLVPNSIGSAVATYSIGVDVVIGAGHSLEMKGNWINQGTIDARDATLFLSGTFVTDSITPARLLRNAGSKVLFSGDLDNRGQNLMLESGPEWSVLDRRGAFDGPRITGGTISGAVLVVRDQLTLDDVTVDNHFQINGDAVVEVPGDLTLNGTMILDGTGGQRDEAILLFSSGVDHTLRGSGDVVFLGTAAELEVRSSDLLTIAAGVTLRTDGTDGAAINLLGSGSWSNLGVIDGRDATVNLDGSFDSGSLDAARLLRNAQSQINILGTLDNTGATLQIDPAATWLFDFSEINGGTISGSPASFTTLALADVIVNNRLLGQDLRVRNSVSGSGSIQFTETDNSLGADPPSDRYTIGVTVEVAAGSSLEITGDWANQSVMDARDATLVLGGRFATSDITPARLLRNAGSTIIFSGELNNMGQTLNLESGPQWQTDSRRTVDRNAIVGGTITGSTLTVAGELNLEDNVTLEVDVIISDRSSIEVPGDLMLNGTITLDGSSAGGRGAAELHFHGGNAHQFSGTGSVIFIGQSAANRIQIASGSTLSIAAGVDVRTGGTIGDSISIAGDGTWATAGVIDGRDAMVHLGGRFSTSSITATNLLRNAQSNINIVGVLDNQGTTLTIDSDADWTIDDGEIVGGTIAGAAITFTTATFENVVLHNRLVGGPELIIRGGLTGSGEVEFTENFNEIGTPPSADPQSPYTIGVDVQVGAGQTLSITGWWTNDAVIDVRDATFNLGVSFTGSLNKTSDITAAKLLRNAGSTIRIGGFIDNSNDTLVLEPGPVWQPVPGGGVSGGVLTGETLTVDQGFSLSGVTVNNQIVVEAGATLSVGDGLTVNGTVTLNGTSGRSFTRLTFSANSADQVVLNGTGEIIFANDTERNRLEVAFGDLLVIESGITIRATAGTFYSRQPLINRGTIVAAGQGTRLLLDVDDFRNEGSLVIGEASVLEIDGDFSQSGTLAISYDGIDNSGTKVTIDGSANLSGSLDVQFVGGFVPAVGQSLLALAFADRAATTFQTITGLNLGGGIVLQSQYTDTQLLLQR